MSQHDYDIANATAPNARTDINNALQALASTSSGTSAPTATFANMIYFNTSTNTLYKRTEADSGWVTLGVISEANDTFTPSGGPTVPAFASLAQAQAADSYTVMMSPARTYQTISANPDAVLNATSQATLSAVGSYAYLGSTTSSVAQGANTAGSNLRYARIYDDAGNFGVTIDLGNAPSGTWKLMSLSFDAAGDDIGTGLFLKVSG
jgi:hypothetical protein